MIPNFSGHEKIAEVRCGPGHSLAISYRGAVYSWGEGFKGKLGLGFSESLR
jgi:alpha-tubulin suppressor-like RCC1 family protein